MNQITIQLPIPNIEIKETKEDKNKCLDRYLSNDFLEDFFN